MAKEERMLFTHYTENDGLCSNAVNDITQDTLGFTWMATTNGISRFDGCRFVNYRVEQYPELLINDLKKVFLLPNGSLTVSSSHSVLSSYDYLTNSFQDRSSFMVDTTYKYDIQNFGIQRNGEGLLSTACGLYRYDLTINEFARILPNLANSYVLDVVQDMKNRYWLLDYNGVYVLDEAGNEIPSYNFKSLMKERVDHHLWLDDYHLLLSSSVGSLWMVHFDEDGTIHTPYKVQLPFQYVSCMVKGDANTVWMGTLGDGLWRISFEKDHTECTKIIPTNEEADALVKISSLFLDDNSNLWVSSLATGVWRTSISFDSPYLTSKLLGLPPCVGSSFAETDEGDLLFGTDGMGLFWMDSSFQVKKNFTVADGLSSNNIITISKQDDGSFLIGYWGGMTDHIWLPSGTVQKIHYTGIEKPIYTTKSILQTRRGKLYVATAGNGVYVKDQNQWQRLRLRDTTMNPYDDVWSEYLCEREDSLVYILSSRSIWSNLSSCTETQFHPIFPDIDKTNTRQPLHFNQAVYDDGLYVAASQGIYRFDKNDSLQKILHGSYSSIIKDQSGQIWLSGADGIYILSKFSEEQPVCMITSDDFSSADYFTAHASFLSSSGKIFFGCRDGFVCVNPSYQQNSTLPFFSFSYMMLHGKLTNASAPHLELNYDDTHFTLCFDLIDYSLLNKPSVYYRIVELDTAWIDLGDKREIEVSYMPTGNFTLEVMVSMNGHQNQIITKHITILPPWWRTNIFRIVCILILAGLFYWAVRLKTRGVERQKVMLGEMVASRTEELRLVNENLSQKNKEIEKQNESLLESLKEKDQMVSVIGHDLKNPMFAIVSALKKLSTRQYTLSEQQTILSKVTQESESLQNEMLKLLQWSAESGLEMAYQPQNFDMTLLVNETVSFLKGMLDEKCMNYKVVDESRYQTYADPRMISTIIRNLLTNAIKFTPTGGNIAIRIYETVQETFVCVADQGMGMTQDQIQSLLEGKNCKSAQGTEEERGFGLGFQIVRDFAAKNAGRIQMNSVVNQGTSITVSFPKSQEERETKQENTVVFPVSVNTDLLQGKSILVVDDDSLLLSHISDLLVDYVTVYQAKSGEEAIKIALEKIPDLIVSDIEMPEMNGLEMYEELKRNLLSANIPLIFLSAKSDVEVRQQSMSLGAISFIAKPFEDNELLMHSVNFLSWQQKKQIQMLSRSIENNDVTKEEINPLLERLMDLIKENYKNPNYSFTDIAEGLGMSKSTLTRRLKSLTDKSPIEILSEYRFSLAKKLVERGELSISEIAYSVGFNDPSYFSRRFKELFGVTPTSQKK